jgi:biotin operon repressor
MRPTKTDLQVRLERHIGRGRGITAADLAMLLGCAERIVRELITELRLEGVAVCGHPSSGYFIAATREELEESIAFLKNRALHSLQLASRMSGMPLADLLGQLHLPT